MKFPCRLPNSLISYLLSSSESNYYRTCDSEGSSQLLKDYATREFNAFLWISLVTVTALLLEKVFKLCRLWSKARRIAGPPCTSFFGHNNFGSRGNFIDLLSELHNEYGSVFKLWLGPTQLLAEKRRESLALQLNEKLVGRANVIPKYVIDCIMERIEEIMGKGNVDCKMVSQHMAFTILGATLFGDAFLAWSKANFYEELLMMIAKDASFWASYRVTPFWKQGFWRYQSLCANLKCLTQDIVQQCRKNCKIFHHVDQNSNDETVKYGMKAASGIPPSGVVLQDKFSRELDGHLNSREEPCGNIMGMMFHGCLATAGLMTNILERLATNPEIQDKALSWSYDYIFSPFLVMGRYTWRLMVRQGSTKDAQNVDKMVLLLATIYESARLLPPGPLLQRCSLKDGVAEGYVDTTRTSFVLNDPNDNQLFFPLVLDDDGYTC
ncbi:hypothetical protein GH714_017840 [Hevea brasiliensis]|uniref:Cytochrome P450 n=1 Tax=Hevea brasiliensis TaxID=3981 RepID=A0A6A6LK74_HEVBR|nr:hypothetical protein GH714_017840 [Hevea brasiliensis]